MSPGRRSTYSRPAGSPPTSMTSNRPSGLCRRYSRVLGVELHADERLTLPLAPRRPGTAPPSRVDAVDARTGTHGRRRSPGAGRRSAVVGGVGTSSRPRREDALEGDVEVEGQVGLHVVVRLAAAGRRQRLRATSGPRAARPVPCRRCAFCDRAMLRALDGVCTSAKSVLARSVWLCAGISDSSRVTVSEPPVSPQVVQAEAGPLTGMHRQPGPGGRAGRRSTCRPRRTSCRAGRTARCSARSASAVRCTTPTLGREVEREDPDLGYERVCHGGSLRECSGRSRTAR